MSQKFKTSLTLLLSLAMIFSMAACAETQSPAPSAVGNTTEPAPQSQQTEATDPAANNAERTLLIWQTTLTSASELDKPEQDWAISKICRDFEAANPGTKVEFMFEVDQPLLQSKLKAAVLANNAPDIANIFSGYLVTSLSDIFTDISSYIPPEDLEAVMGWEGLSHNLMMGNPIYGYPASGAEMGLLVYNRQLIEQAGVDLEGSGAPKNAAEFIDAMKKIQTAGIQPIIGADDGANTAYMYTFGSWWPQMVGTERVTSNSLGTTKFADDTAFIDSLDLVAQMYADGIINKDYATNADPLGGFLAGQAAMLITGNWDVQNCIDGLGEENIGVYAVPNFKADAKYQNATIGGIGQALTVMSTCKDPQLATSFLSFLSNKDNVVELSRISGRIPHRKDITAEDMGWNGMPAYEKLLKISAQNLLPWNDNSMQPDVMNEYYKQTGLAVIGTITAQQCAEALDAKAAEAN